MEHPYSLRDIQKETGLKYDFLRRIVKEIPELADAHAVKGMNNALFFDTNGLICFREIGKMKELGYTVPTIKEQILTSLPNQVKKLQNPPTERQPNTDTQGEHVLLKLLETAQANERENYKLTLAAKDALIEQQERTIRALDSGLKLLTDGRSPEDVRRDIQEKERELAALRLTTLKREEQGREYRRLLQELSKLRWYQSKKRRLLLSQLQGVSNELGAE
ncbi:hypothetical protein COW36_24970 [bacterium (Candidatus Blackallbacteria) CG17_big_fil_post_rev_8_21_14_2_50_48_46]|uniref:Uncharacterized protein n=1 Tax=bacterium (Candidatus Blackallbacteria) CG17_big_fil_post_rev_8_21_14_2_50_48_46 TaxID=2014261 RepID=A0A2M7FX58_9BACT|nr:MAG: hypothetical protein COW64_07975 [bacterium (Candidatus Blackallbacteria) CG18_big_fil_WC_8_21_14_2_50_49_26]PIW13657.1 MAG: hypothetical protein COW36_24970 [bacterium (Candidatus Blackallbacteria) CG17_big_fil_post_rev_8_21_14_2_50_48_46]